MDSYSILGIEKESSMEDIEKAYIDKISKIKKENYRIYIAFMPKKKANYVIYQCQFYLTKEKAQELEDEIEKYKTSKKE